MRTKWLLFLLFSAFLVTSCDKIEELLEGDKKDDPNTIGGTTTVPLNEVGNVVDVGTVTVGTKSYDLKETIKVIKNDNGLTTVEVKATIPNSPEIQNLVNRLPASVKDANGNINTTIDFKITSEGIQDFFNKDHKQHTIVKYDANVGDTYKITKSDGSVITRTVTQKSTTDDYPYGFMNIKVITVEQDSRIPGVKKIVYKANHKFGLVNVQFVLEDGSVVGGNLYTTKY